MVHFSKKGIEKYRNETIKLEVRVRELNSRTQATAETGGDMWHDNPSLYNLMSEKRSINSMLGRNYEVLRTAQVVDYPSSPQNVCLGCTVVIEDNGNTIKYHIAGYGESDPNNFVIAYDTPLAKSIINKKPGDSATIEISGKVRLLKVIEVKPYDNR